VRLKGGDPFIFGRGGEELEACREAGVDCVIVPGVTAALAAGASAGAPLTHRGAAQAVTFVTGHAAKGGEPDLDWAASPRPTTPSSSTWASRPPGHRRAPDGRRPRIRLDPGPVVENASPSDERRIVTTLAALADAAAGLSGPALLMVGEAMAMAADSRRRPRRSPSSFAEARHESAHRQSPDRRRGRVLEGRRLGRGFGDAQLFDDERWRPPRPIVVAHGKAQPTVIDVYPIDLAPVDGAWAPVSYRERIRALGPTNDPTHGKQAVGGAVIEALRHAAGAARSTGRVDLIRRK
jgi:hypothetical protein